MLWREEAKPSQALSRALLSGWEKGRRAFVDLVSEEGFAAAVAVERGSSMGMRL